MKKALKVANKRKRQNCILCTGTKFIQLSNRIRDSKKHKVIQCKKCSHVQISPLPSEQELKKFNDENLQAKNIKHFLTISNNRKKSLVDTIRRFELIKKLTPEKKRVLEIGSGPGFFLEYMKKYHFDIIGIEVSKENRKISKKLSSAKVLNIDLNYQELHERNFNTIVLFHVLEHVPNPIKFLNNIRKLLNAEGKIVIEVPNFNDLQLTLNNEYKNWYWQLAHISYFSPKTIKKTLRQAGYKHVKILGVQRYSVENMFNWKLIAKPQIDMPTFNLIGNYGWLERFYKDYLEKKFQSDTLIAIASKN